MARRHRSAAEQGFGVPRWVVTFDPDDWPGGFYEWSAAVRLWIKDNLYKWEHYGAWIDLTRNLYIVQAELREQGYGLNADAA